MSSKKVNTKCTVVDFIQLNEDKCRLIGTVPTKNLIDKTKYKKKKSNKGKARERNIDLLRKPFGTFADLLK